MRERVRTVLARLEPDPRVVDWSILALVSVAVATGLWSLTAGRPRDWVVFWAHGVAGLALVFLLGSKFRRVWPRVRDPGRWRRSTVLSITTATVAVAALATGVYWVLGGNFSVLLWNAMNVHILFGLLTVPLVLGHLWTRFRPVRRRDVEGRRDALRYAGLLVGGAVLWRGEQALNRALDTAGAERRFTGSKPVEGDGFPVTSWVADDPDPIAREDWTLAVDGLVDTPTTLSFEDLTRGTTTEGEGLRRTEREALLDCTSGWYTVEDWRGIRVGDLLDAVGTDDDANYVRFVSRTGYRWSLPLAEAREALLATHVGGAELSHGHGAPARLVAPGRRGFQWVKWVERVEVRQRADAAQWVVTLVSGFD